MSKESPVCWQWNDDRFLSVAGVPFTDRGFRYGMSVFESIVIHNGRPVFLREHLNRLALSCAV